MKIKLLIFAMLIGLTASAQNFTNFNPYGVQQKITGSDTTLRLVGSTSGKYIYPLTKGSADKLYGYTAGYGMSLVGQQFRVDSSKIATNYALSQSAERINKYVDSRVKTNLRSTTYVHNLTKTQPWLFIGDSITEGTATNDFTNDNWASIVRRVFQSYFGVSDYGFQNFNPYLNQSTINTFMKYTFSGFGDGTPFNGVFYGGVAVNSNTSGEYVEFTYTGKDFSVVYTQNPTDGALLQLKVDGVNVDTIDTKLRNDTTQMPTHSDYGSFFTQSVSTYGAHTVRITNLENKSATLSGIQFANNAASFKTPLLNNVGRSSIAMTQLSDEIIDYYCTTGSLVLSLGVNDDLLGTDTTVFKAKYYRFLENIKSNGGQIIVQDFIFSKPQSNVYKTILRLGAEKYHVTFIDYALLWVGSSANNIKYGLLDADGVHPSTSGHIFIANSLLYYLNINTDRNILRQLDIGEIGANTSGSAARWAGLAIDQPVTSPTITGVLAADGTTTIKNASASSLLNFLSIPIGGYGLGDVVDINNTSTKPATFYVDEFGNGDGVSVQAHQNSGAGSQPAFVWRDNTGAKKYQMYWDAGSNVLHIADGVGSDIATFSGGKMQLPTTPTNPTDAARLSDLGDFVTTNTVQTVTAIKTFSNSVNFQNITATGIEANVLTLAQKAIPANTNYSVLEPDYTVLVQGGTTNVTITMPNSAIGKMYVIKRVNGGTNTVTISAAAIDGVTNKDLTVDYSGYVLQSAGAGQYYIIGKF